MTLLKETYQAALDAGKIRPDPAQKAVVEAMDAFIRQFKPKHGKGFWSIFQKSAAPTRGIYIYGPVGRGKTMLMDWCLKALQHEGITAERWHFHEFMLKIHHNLKELKETGGQLDSHVEQLADAWAERIRVLCFDEFHVTDVADAMIMMPLFTRLFARGVAVVSTSNWAPDELYKNGLQRQRFLPFITRIKTGMDVVSLAGDTDYRALKRRHSAAWLCPLDPDTAAIFDVMFHDLAGHDPVHADSLQIGEGASARKWPIPAAVKDMARLDMDRFLAQPMGAADFIALARRYNLLFLDNLPQFTADANEKAKRFMVMIDVLYDKGVKLAVRAAAMPESLYPANGPLAFEFSRTISRLNEMAHVQSNQVAILPP